MFDHQDNTCKMVTKGTPISSPSKNLAREVCHIKTQGSRSINSNERIASLAQPGDWYVILAKSGGMLNTLTIKDLKVTLIPKSPQETTLKQYKNICENHV